MCEALGQGDTDHWIHVADGDRTGVYLDRASRITGYCPGGVAPRTRGRNWSLTTPTATGGR